LDPVELETQQDKTNEFGKVFEQFVKLDAMPGAKKRQESDEVNKPPVFDVPI
jgi:hypothetical protein